MRIVQVANFVTPTSGGLRRTLEALGPRYVEAGHRSTFVHPGPSRQSGVVSGVRVEQIAGAPLPMSGGYRVITRRVPLQRLLTAIRPDVVELSDKTTLSWLPEWRKCSSFYAMAPQQLPTTRAEIHAVSSGLREWPATRLRGDDPVVSSPRKPRGHPATISKSRRRQRRIGRRRRP
ncbi:MAG: hypothetical protein M3431_06020 [Actinomycetota bacterium]|nr:hypothetical protein [Actinomycetota bacterium]